MNSATRKKIKAKSREFLANRRQANNLVDIMAVFESGDDADVLPCMRALHSIFCCLLAGKEMYFDKPPVEQEDVQDLDTDGKLRMWLRERYGDFRNHLLKLLVHPNSNIQELSLCTLMKLVEAEVRSPLSSISSKHVAFPTLFFRQIVQNLLSEERDMDELLNRCQEYMEYDDVRYFTMKIVLSDLQEKQQEMSRPLSAVYLDNIYSLLTNLGLPKSASQDALCKFMARLPQADGIIKMANLKEHRKLFTMLWLKFLSCKLPTSLYKKVLLVLSDQVMPYMTSPLLLADFLTNSYNIGGAISLLALNGLFILISAFNLDYPDFFKKLYALFEPSLFHVKYRARFFFLADMFLTSSHLPAYLVAAFIKKLSRLSLTAPPSGLTLILPFIQNLIHRHGNCRVLVHNPQGPTDVISDPYLAEEEDPAKCKALESSLWEIKTLQEHYHHILSTEAKKFNNPFTSGEIDLSDILESNANELFDKEVKKKMKTIPVTFDPPTGLFRNKEDKFTQLWVLE